MTPSSTAPIRSVNHTYTDLSSTVIPHQFSVSGDVAQDYTGGNLYNEYFTTRTGSGTNYFPGLFGLQSDLTINGDFVANARAYTAQLNHETTSDVGNVALLRINAPNYTSTGRPTNLFGIYIDTQSGARALSYSLYSVGGSNYFGGDITAAAGITLGGVRLTSWPSGGAVAWADITGKPTFGTLSAADWPASDGQEYVAKNGAWAVATGGGGGGSGTVTSVALTVPAGFSVSGSPITTNGTLAVTGTLATSAGGTGITNTTAAGQALLSAADPAAQRTALALGTAATNNVPASGNAASGEVVLGSDTRLTDSRTPTSHSHDAGAITSGVFNLARLATGTPNSSNFLRGDGAFAQVTTNDVPGLVAALAAGGGGGSSVSVDGTAITGPNWISSADITNVITAVTNIAPTIRSASVTTNKIDSTFRSWVESMAGGGGTTNIVSSSAAGLAPHSTLANAVLGTDGSTNVAWRSWTIDAGRATVTNTVAETTIFEEILPAGTLSADYQALQFDVMGIVRNDVGTSQTYRVRFYVNDTVVYNSITPTFTTLSVNRAFVMNGRWIRTASNVMDLYGTHSLHGGTAPTTGLGSLGLAAGVPNSPFGARGASCDWTTPVTNKMTLELSAASTSLWADLNWRIYR
jgi:hypothetical protein